jgi:hypothetical protein
MAKLCHEQLRCWRKLNTKKYSTEVVVRIGEQRIGATARVLDREIDRKLWAQVAAIADRKYGWGEGLPVEISPLNSPEADPQCEGT